MRSRPIVLLRTGALLLLVAALLATPSATRAVAPAMTQRFDLCAKVGTLVLPGSPSLPIWGFALKPANTPCSSAAVVARIPGPTLSARAGDSVNIVLHNEVPGQAISLLFAGQNTGPGAAVAPSGGSASYSFVASEPGSFLYESGSNARRQVPMGLYGPMVVYPVSGGTAYGTPASAYDAEALLVLGEIDPALNSNPLGFKLVNYAPKFWLINGKPYPRTTTISAAPGQRLLLRYFNAGSIHHTMSLLGQYQRVVARDAFAERFPYDALAETIPAGQTGDLIASIPASAAGARYPLFSRQLHVTNQASYPGGMLTFVTVIADTLGPSSPSFSAAPNPSAGATRVDLRAVVIDPANGSSAPSNIAAAEWFTGADPGAGNATPLMATDGLFDSPSESLLAVVDVSGWTPGAKVLSLRARDTAGNWGPVRKVTLTIS